MLGVTWFEVICFLLNAYLIAVVARVLLSWFPINPHGVVATIGGFLYMVTDPVIMPLRRRLPALRLGQVALDLSPVVAIIAIMIVQALLRC